MTNYKTPQETNTIIKHLTNAIQVGWSSEGKCIESEDMNNPKLKGQPKDYGSTFIFCMHPCLTHSQLKYLLDYCEKHQYTASIGSGRFMRNENFPYCFIISF